MKTPFGRCLLPDAFWQMSPACRWRHADAVRCEGCEEGNPFREDTCSVLRKRSLSPDLGHGWVSNVALGAVVGAPPKASSIVDSFTRNRGSVEYSRHLLSVCVLEALEHHVSIRAAGHVDVDEAFGFIQLAGASVLRLNPQRYGGSLLRLGEVAGVAQEASPSA